jgi:hypothetical protein
MVFDLAWAQNGHTERVSNPAGHEIEVAIAANILALRLTAN